MNDTCTGCGKYTEFANKVTIERTRTISLVEYAMGRKRKLGKRGDPTVGRVFVAEGLCDHCIMFIEATIRLLWERQSMDAKGIK